MKRQQARTGRSWQDEEEEAARRTALPCPVKPSRRWQGQWGKS